MAYDVSVIIPIYNCEKLLPKCLDSLAKQTINSIQVIMVDDGSTDSSKDIIDYYERLYPNFKACHKNNGGTASARNYGLLHATGEYVGFVDSDDWVEQNMYEVLFSIAKSNNSDIVFTRVFENETPGANDYYFPRGGYYSRKQMEIELFPYVLPCLIDGAFTSIRWANWLRIYKREIIEKNNIRFCNKSRRCEDMAFNFECTIHSNSYFYYNESSLYHNVVNPYSKTRNYTKDMTKSISSLMEYMCEVVDNYKEYDFRKQNEMSIANFAINIVWNEMRAPNKKVQRKQLKELINSKVIMDVIVNSDIQGLKKTDKLIYNTLKLRIPFLIVWSIKCRSRYILAKSALLSRIKRK